MRVVLQRVSEASVTVDGARVARIGRGYLVLAGFSRDDTDETLRWMARKVTTLRVFEDDEGRMSRSLEAIDGRLLVVSQFTLYGNCNKGTRPSYDKSASAEDARSLYERFVSMVEQEAPGRVETGEFQAKMEVALVNDGPVTIVIEKEAQ
jgi:D-tyrosyl-tRNA(Tyr) deacylase